MSGVHSGASACVPSETEAKSVQPIHQQQGETVAQPSRAEEAMMKDEVGGPGHRAGEAQTGVGAIISAAHADKSTGAIHGHSYEVVAWFPSGGDALELQRELERACRDLDHTTLPPEIAWAEDIARRVKSLLGCAEVEIRRPLERLYARVR